MRWVWVPNLDCRFFKYCKDKIFHCYKVPPTLAELICCLVQGHPILHVAFNRKSKQGLQGVELQQKPAIHHSSKIQI